MLIPINLDESGVGRKPLMKTKKALLPANNSRVLRLIWMNPGISRAELARDLRLDKSTVTDIVGKLKEHRIIEENEKNITLPQGGRPPIGLEINPDYAVVAGIEIQNHLYTLVISSLAGGILHSETVSMSVSRENLLETVVSVLETAGQKAAELNAPLIGAGVGVTGMVNPENGNIYYSIPLDIYTTYNLYDELNRRVDVPVLIENDANCCAWGEIAFHKSLELKDFLFVLAELGIRERRSGRKSGIGVGFGFVFNGEVYHGRDYSAGEFKSLNWRSGNTSQFSLTDEESTQIDSDRKLRRKLIREISRHVAFLANTLNLQQVFIGGDLERYQDEIVPLFKQELVRTWSYQELLDPKCKIAFSTYEHNAVAYGAAGMLLEHLFSLPEMETAKRRGDFRLSVFDYIAELSGSSEWGHHFVT